MTSAEDAKACCSRAYGTDAVAMVLGPSYHPGGLSLTRRLAERLGVRAGHRVLDVAAGTGTTARMLAADFDVTVDGVELGQDVLESAVAETQEAGLSAKVGFHHGDAEHIPLPDGRFDTVVCECAFCTFPDKERAAAELARVLRDGGRAGITDVTVTGEGLPAELSTLAAWVACIADARSLEEYSEILAGAGLTTVCTERHDAALERMIEQIDARVRLLRMTSFTRLHQAGVDVDAVLRYCALAREAVADGLLGYALLVAEKR
ncbi:methyltransferase domain-containing protein [Haloechinothrix sp. YIM 98757]|uniref:Methyltransferase domain-containing protein n=1 Tax=Haloechinothrix aidingensis TaxID=2752311 RepID=A0A838A7D8_9PSEU|nr:methyltransferase domain-containing protein [Haloechinothrix aidingensis]MBA0125118.1 methyltransferase domain-containing protein [Haloechinothrix aidingensis]